MTGTIPPFPSTAQVSIPDGLLDRYATFATEFVRIMVIIGGTAGVAVSAGTQAQLVVIIGGVLSLVSLALAWFNHSKVYSAASAQKIANEAAISGNPSIEAPPAPATGG